MKQYETDFVDLTGGPAFLVHTLRGSCSVQATDDLRLGNECQIVQEVLRAIYGHWRLVSRWYSILAIIRCRLWQVRFQISSGQSQRYFYVMEVVPIVVTVWFGYFDQDQRRRYEVRHV
jgi:hypothetical protein